ncbi:MAG: DNA repair protein RecN [Hyphomicrobiaceae bacterium]|nr:DNA repair protein RecN [Hyphomicrobiaceae bacterium]
MLSALYVRDIVLIDALDLSLSEGLMVLTGETGAGKSILLDALALALGSRGDQALVRVGEDKGMVTAVFEPASDHPVFALLEESGIEAEGSVILRRVQYVDGRTKAFINDQPVSARLLHDAGHLLVEIHGQHDERALTDPASHRALLDAFGQLEGEAATVEAAFRGLADAQSALDHQLAKVERARADEDYARHVVEEIDQFKLQDDEEALLAERRSLLQQLEKAADDVRDADEVLNGTEAPAGQLAVLARRLERKGAGEGSLFSALLEDLDATLEAFGRASDSLEAIKRQMAFDPNELEAVEERLFALRALARKHNVAPDGLSAIRARYAGELDLLQSGEEELAALKEAVTVSEKSYHGAAARLSAKRKSAAAALGKAVMAELPDLKLGAATFIVDLDTDTARISASGYDQVGFVVQTNPGTRPGPIMKVASGGELSRLLLALKVVLAEKGSAPVLIFDEIDTGVGGAVADAVGRRLARLADKVQVLTITHAPQVAARADRHLLIEKKAAGKGEGMRTSVQVLAASERDEEVARMLAGAQITAEARAAAKRLIAEVG